MEGNHKIIGLRPSECLWEKEWTFPSWEEFFKEPEKFLAGIPESERYNLHATIARTVDKRELYCQDIVVFDIDDIETDRIDDYLDLVAFSISEKGTRDNIAFVSSGHGIHAYAKLAQPIEDESDFKLQKRLYEYICKRIEVNLESAELIGCVDRGVFAKSHLIRLPGTTNKKEDKDAREVEILSGLPELEVDLLLEASAVDFLVDDEEYIHEKALTRMPPIDGPAVLDGCEFLKYCKYNQEKVSEPEWIAMLSIVTKIEPRLGHEYSEQHPKYNFKKTELKIEHALNNCGPRTCDNICGLWDGCKDCEHFGNVVSPITIKSPEYIATEKTGFRKLNKKGEPKSLAYEDLVKFFERQQPYISVADARQMYIWEDQYWKPIEDVCLENFALRHIEPDCTGAERFEFIKRIKCTNIRRTEFFETERLLNVRNGVLDLSTMELRPFSPDYGFKYKLDYDFDKEATAPRFDQFLDEVTLERKELRDILEEFAGYCFSGVNPAVGERAMILLGEGSNGKSVFLDTLFNLVPEEASSALMLSDLGKEYNLDQLHGKLFNLSEETPKKSLVDGSSFKNLITGGRVNARKPYGLPYTYVSTAKFIFACNELPKNMDATHGMMRKLLIIPFDARFDRSNRDAFLREKLKKEASGILNIFIKGYQRFIEQGEFTDSSVVERELQSYREETDTVLTWFNANCEWTGNIDAFVSVKGAYLNYSQWCLEENLNRDMVNGSVHFSKRLSKVHPSMDRKIKRIDNLSTRGFTGFRYLNPDNF